MSEKQRAFSCREHLRSHARHSRLHVPDFRVLCQQSRDVCRCCGRRGDSIDVFEFRMSIDHCTCVIKYACSAQCHLGHNSLGSDISRPEKPVAAREP